jgi:hypothetical protein
MAAMHHESPLALAAVEAIQGGDVEALCRLLAEHPELATARIGGDDPDGMTRTLLHVVTDWPGHLPNGAATMAAVIQAGADVNWVGYDDLTPLDAAVRSEAHDLGAWVRSVGGTPASP